jgi:hypothetical protein
MPGGATSATATLISTLPYTDADTCTLATPLWYRYTSPTPAVPNVIAVFVYTADRVHVGSNPVMPLDTQVYSPNDSTLIMGSAATNIGIRNKDIQVPMTAGATYYFKITSAFGDHPYTISVLAAPSLSAPAGSIFVNDDGAGSTVSTGNAIPFPLALLSAIDGTVLRFVNPFPSGENGDVIATGAHIGRILVHDRFNANHSARDHLALYDSQFTLIADLSYGATTGLRYPIRTNKSLATKFYVGQPADPAHAGKATVTTVTSAGAFGATTWVLPLAGLAGIAPSLDETILYHSGQSSPTNSPVGRWDLVNNVALTNLAAGLGATWVTQDDILVLADGTIVVSYESTSVLTAPVVKHYAADGTVLNTYTLTGSRSQDVRLAYALDDPISFWVWTKLGPSSSAGNGLSRFRNVKVSDGSTLTTFDCQQYGGGVWFGAVTATPSPRFGHSESCPFLIIRQAFPSVAPPPAPPACVHACLLTEAPITGGGQACQSTLTAETGGGQACRLPDTPGVECAE